MPKQPPFDTGAPLIEPGSGPAGQAAHNLSAAGKLSGRTYTYADLKGGDRALEHPLSGFQPHYGSLVDYILRCTFRIWEEKNVGLIRTHYAAKNEIYTPGGFYGSADEVIEATIKTLHGFPDRQLYSLNIIWDGDEKEGYLSSHLIRSIATNQGESEFGAPTGKRVDVFTIADCLCKDNLIIREWMIRDNGDYVRQLGFDLEEVAGVRAEAKFKNKQSWWFQKELEARIKAQKPATNIQTHLQPHSGSPIASDPKQVVLTMLNDLRVAQYYGLIDEYCSYNIQLHGIGGRRVCGTPHYKDFLALFDSSFTNRDFRVEHIQSIASDAGEHEHFVHVRWSITGEHVSGGLLGTGTGATLYVLGISHYRLVNGRIAEEWTVFDELALWEQIKLYQMRS